MKLTKPRKVVLIRLVRIVSLLSTVRRKPLERGHGAALDLRALADELESGALREWHATAAAQLKEQESKRTRRPRHA